MSEKVSMIFDNPISFILKKGDESTRITADCIFITPWADTEASDDVWMDMDICYKDKTLQCRYLCCVEMRADVPNGPKEIFL